MQPIKTTNAMNPAPAKGIESFPTPVIDDVVISEIVNSWKGDYQPLEYGTLWKDVSHAPNQGSFPEHKLVYQQPTSEDGQWVKRIWVNDRVNQDSYNYAIKYSAGSQDHPIYIRTYIVPRETYAPLLDGTPDPLFPGALLVDEEAVRNEGELDSKYITVTRVYETLPGPQVPTKRYNERGDLETVIVQTVPPNTPPTPDSLLVTQSQVEQVETGKGVRTTARVTDHSLLQIKEKKAGLLGETITTDDIVDPSENPDELSETVVASVVEQYTATKARKRTTTSTGPSFLESNSLIESPLGLVDANIERSIVNPEQKPSTNEIDNYTIVKDQINPIDIAKSEREKIQVSQWPTNTGVDYDEQLGIGIYYTETIIKPSDYSSEWYDLSNKNIKPIDQWKSLKREINKKKISEALLKQWYKVGIDTQITLPDKLLDVTVYWGQSWAKGNDYDFGNGVFTGSYNRNQSGSSKTSFSINGDIYFNIQKGFSGTIPGYEHIFFIEIGSDGEVSQGDVLTRLNFLESNKASGIVYKNWPYLQLRSENIVIISGGKSLSLSKSLSESVSINGFAQSTGTGESFDVNVNANSVNVPECLHGEIRIKNEYIGTSGEFGATAAVRPEKLLPTKAKIGGSLVEVPQFPVGDYLLNSNIELYKWGFVKVTARTISITNDYV